MKENRAGSCKIGGRGLKVWVFSFSLEKPHGLVESFDKRQRSRQYQGKLKQDCMIEIWARLL